MSKYVLVSYKDNWGDEMDIGGSQLIEKVEWSKLVGQVANYFSSGNNNLTNYIGANEEIIYESFIEWFNSYSVIELTDTQVTVLQQLLENYDYKRSCECQFFYPELD